MSSVEGARAGKGLRHPLHSICPYFAMFPEEFVTRQVMKYTRPGDLVFDPFCGRGTTVFESLLQGRDAAGLDINPVAACVSGAKANPPDLDPTLARLRELEEMYEALRPVPQPSDDFFRSCFHPETLDQILFLRKELSWQGSHVDRFIAAVVLGCLHGESQKSPNYLSNQMPRTISTKPDSSVRWWAMHGLEPPRRNAFRIVGGWIAYRLGHRSLVRRGKVALQDARRAYISFPELVRKVDLVVTSPPYLNTTNFREDQWLRLWFLGGPARPTRIEQSDDRYRSEGPYWNFLAEAWRGCSSLMKPGTVVVIRIGGRSLDKETLPQKLFRSLSLGMDAFKVFTLQERVETEIVNRQTNAFRPGSTAKRFESDFVFGLS